MICPKCHNDKTYVLDGQRTSTGYQRRRKCPKCHLEFSTSENYTGIYSHYSKLKRRYHREAVTPIDNSAARVSG